MAYPNVPGPYGLKPVNLVGGQVFSGSTRNLPIAYGYATNIFFGDFVDLSRGFINRLTVTTNITTTFPVGIFLGCSYTDPVTRQKRFSQYWPASTLAGDAVAVVTDDPDTVFKAAVCSTTNVIGSSALSMVGQNVAMIDNYALSNVTTGDSANAVQGVGATPATTSSVARVVGVVPETAYSVYGTGSSATAAITLTGLGLSGAVLQGADVSYIAPNGQTIETGSFLTTGYTQGTTALTMNQQALILGSAGNIPAASTIVFTVYPEVYVKLNFGQHAYYSSVATA